MSQLNDRQLQAVTTTEGRVRIVAGAGSGKTTVLAHRYAFIVNEIGIAPGNILCMTFTNKAASEMRRRISRMVERGVVNDFICTIHGFCAKFLRSEIYRIGYPKNFTILDPEDARQLARQVMQEYGIDRRKTTAERFLGDIGKMKGADAEGYILNNLLPDCNPDAQDPFVRFLRLQLKQYALDYDDLQYFTIYILRNFPEARKKWTERLNYIMVDEAQDCSSDDWQLIYLLSSFHNNLFVVGDPDQAIYEWRGASPRMFVDFKADHTVILDRNYRSTPQILAVANAIIAHNKDRIPKDLWSDLPAGDLPEHFHLPSRADEVKAIAEYIQTSVEKGAAYGDFAILYRSSFISAEIERALVRLQIPYTVWGGVKFLERREIKDILSYLRLVDKGDDMAFERIVNTPSRKFGKVSLDKLRDIAQSEGTSLYLTLKNHSSEKPFNSAHLRRFIALVEEARLRREVSPVSEIADFILTRSGYTDMLRNDEEEERLENLSELMRQMSDYETTHESEEVPSLTMYLQDIALYTHEPDDRDTSDAVRMMTIHQAKGLEFPRVIIIGLTEGTFPSHRTIRERRQQGEEEERRLMYVAVTRAMQQLRMYESEGFLNDSGALKFPSRFLYEMPEETVTRHGTTRETLYSGTQAAVATLNADVYGTAAARFAVGDTVRHRIFGQGTVEAYDKDADSYTVRFADCTRTLLPRVLSKP